MKKILSISLFIIVIITSLVSYLGYQQVYAPLSDSDELILIPRETSFEVLKDSLQVHGLMKNTDFFDFFCTQKRFSKIHTGRYLVRAEMDLNSMVNMLRLGAQKPLDIIFNNASTLEDLADVFSKYKHVNVYCFFN